MIRCLSGEEIKHTAGVISACRELERAGLLEKDSMQPTLEALRRRREFLPHGGPLSEAAIERLRSYLAGDQDVTDGNRAEYRELAAAGLMAAGHTFRDGDESVYRLTKESRRPQARQSEQSTSASALGASRQSEADRIGTTVTCSKWCQFFFSRAHDLARPHRHQRHVHDRRDRQQGRRWRAARHPARRTPAGRRRDHIHLDAARVGPARARIRLPGRRHRRRRLNPDLQPAPYRRSDRDDDQPHHRPGHLDAHQRKGTPIPSTTARTRIKLAMKRARNSPVTENWWSGLPAVYADRSW